MGITRWVPPFLVQVSGARGIEYIPVEVEDMTVYAKTITVGGAYSAAQLAAGVAITLPLGAGDVIPFFQPFVPVAFDGTTPIGFIKSSGGDSYGGVFDLSVADVVAGAIREAALYFDALNGTETPYSHRIESATTLKLHIAQDTGGTPIDSTVGEVVVYVIVYPAAQMVDLDA